MSEGQTNSMEYKTDVLIVGGGPAGIQATRLIRTHSPDTRVTVIRPEPHSMVYCAIPYAMEGLFPLSKTFKSDQLLLEVGGELIRSQVSRIDFPKSLVELEDGRTLGYSQLLIATGAVPIRPPLPGIDLRNVFTVKTAADTQAIMARLSGMADCDLDSVSRESQKDLVAVVVGSGAIGIEQATAYRARGAEVHLIEMRDHVLPHLMDADMTGPLQQQIEELGIHLHLNASLEAIRGAEEAEQVELSKGETIALKPGRDFVVISVGVRPDLDFLDPRDIEMKPDGLVVNEQMRTSVVNVWAAGDCVAGWSGIDGAPLGGKLATNAVPMAKVAARDMLGKPARYPGFYNGAATVVGEWRAAGTGFTETYAATRDLKVFSTFAQSTTRFPMMPGAGEVRVKLVVEHESGRIIGGQILGSEAVAERIDVITLAIQRGMTAAELADLSYSAQPWQTFFPAKNAIVEAASEAANRLSSARY
jgi:NADH oxidase (H2O2-forming)